MGLLAADSLWYWKTSKERRTRHHWWRWSFALFASFGGIFLGSRYPWVNWVVTMVYAIVAVEYIVDFFDLFGQKGPSTATTNAATKVPAEQPAA